MPTLTINQSGKTISIPFEGETALSTVLSREGLIVSHPCAGRGVCGKCAVKASGSVSSPTPAEERFGKRLSCQITLLGDCEIELPDPERSEQIEMGNAKPVKVRRAARPTKIGAAVDIGTTTVVAAVFDLDSRELVARKAAINPQREIAADVMGRISAAMSGESSRLQNLAADAIESLIREAGFSPYDIQDYVITGNTTMLYLLCGLNPQSLSHAPFNADSLFGETVPFKLGKAYLPSCIGAFVGADLVCACLSSGIFDKGETALLIDVGTNGEIALYDKGTVYVTSAAAGPAFEGAGISCGMGASNGAIDRVEVLNGGVHCHVIGGGKAVGVCGSGIVDAVAAFLRIGAVDDTGASDEDDLLLSDSVSLKPCDIRAVQLAKAAISAAIDTVMDFAGVDISQIETFYIAGGFGSRLNIDSAARIGLFPMDLKSRATVIGNAALDGASAILLDRGLARRAEKIAASSQIVALGGNPNFNERYIGKMMFPEFG